MSKCFSGVAVYPAGLWVQAYQFLHKLAEDHVAAWGSTLQYRHRYTNPDAAKRARRLL